MKAFSALLALCEGIPLTKASGAELWCFLWSAPDQTFEIGGGDLRRHGAHCDVIVMSICPGFLGSHELIYPAVRIAQTLPGI